MVFRFKIEKFTLTRDLKIKLCFGLKLKNDPAGLNYLPSKLFKNRLVTQ